MTTFYLDTSVAVHALLGDEATENWFDTVTADQTHELVSSRILRTQLTRVLRREGLPVSDRNAVLDHIALLRLTEAILTSAESIHAHVKTLDAIHLASAMAIGADTVVVTHDAQLDAVALALGLTTLDPVASLRSVHRLPEKPIQ